VSGAFAGAPEAVLQTYARPDDPKRPPVCFDEASKELHAQAHAPEPARPGQAARQDGTWERQGTANRFLLACPLRGWRHGEVTGRRTKVDFAQRRRALVGEHFPEAELIPAVLDNLPTHTKGALGEAFPPPEAKRSADRLQFVYAPTHASGLNRAELEWSVPVRQGLGRRSATAQALRGEAPAWAKARNAAGVEITRSFRLPDARVKLAHLYPANSL
jgi:DDE superfamily endonuclease